MLKTNLKILNIALHLYISGAQIEILRKRADKEISEDNISSFSHSETLHKLQNKINRFRLLEKQIISLKNLQM